MNPQQRQWLLCVLLLASTLLHCAKAERACKTHEDCPDTSAKRYCFQGFCSEQACEPGTEALCFDGPTALVGKGICRSGKRLCDAEGQWLPCLGQTLPQIEICDRRDNDCDGKIDQAKGLDCTCKPGTKQECYSGPKGSLTPTGSSADRWLCQKGIQYCELDNKWGPCYAEKVPTPEVCDKRDNDCDGEIDENIRCTCKANSQRACPNNIPSRGLCKAGVQRCGSDGLWGACEGETPPAAEICDGKDNDCDGTTDGARVDCKGVLLCLGGKCQCPPPLTACNGACTTIEQNSQNCGACGNKCPTGSRCEAGVCQCPNGQSACKRPDGSHTCIDTQTNAQHCGKCGQPCKGQEYCDAGTCKRCPATLPSCGERCCGTGQACCEKACADLQADAENCGKCGNKCKAGQLCCGGACVDVSEDAKHCGACNSAKNPTACTAKERCCGGTCVAESDPKHCGACGKPCAPGEGCCQGVCTALRSDPKNCTSCGTQCAKGQSCCGLDGCKDVASDANHCGKCGVKCAVGEICCGGSCHYQVCPTGKSYPSASKFSLRDVAVDSQGAIYILGNYTSPLTLTCAPLSGAGADTAQTIKPVAKQDMFLLKLNAAGTKCLWLRGAGGVGDDEGSALVVSQDDYAHITGAATDKFVFYSAASTPLQKFSNNLGGNTTAFILSVRSTGDPQPSLATPITPGPSIGNDIAVQGDTLSGYVYIVGEMAADSAFGNHTAIAHKTRISGFAATLKLSTREFVWAAPKSAPTQVNVAYSVAYNAKLGVFGVAGTTLRGSTLDTFLQTYTEITGAPLRRGSFANKAPQLKGIALAASPTGDWYMTGHSTANLGSTTFAESFLTRWARSTTAGKLDMKWTAPVKLLHLASEAITIDAKGQVYITGGFDEVILGNKRRFGVAVAGYNSMGTRLLLREATATAPARASGLVIASNRTLWLVGQFQKEIDFAPPKLNTTVNGVTQPLAGFTWQTRLRP